MFYNDRVRAGISVPQVFARGINIQTSDTENEFNLVNHLIVSAAVDVISNDKWKLTPSLLYRNAQFVGNQLDGAIRLGWKNMVGVSAMYRTAYGFAGIFDLNLFNKINLAYSYGFGTNSSITGVSKGSHEVMLGIKLCRKSKPVKEEVKVQEEEIIEEEVQEEVALLEVKDTVVIEDAPIQETLINAEEAVDEQDDIKIEEKKSDLWIIDIDSLNNLFASKERVVLFELNSSENVISDNQQFVVEIAAKILNEHPNLSLNIVGHTCDIGTTNKNQLIAKQRAEQIRNSLVEKGIENERLSVHSKGESSPVMANTSEKNRAQNRRVVLVFER